MILRLALSGAAHLAAGAAIGALAVAAWQGLRRAEASRAEAPPKPAEPPPAAPAEPPSEAPSA